MRKGEPSSAGRKRRVTQTILAVAILVSAALLGLSACTMVPHVAPPDMEARLPDSYGTPAAATDAVSDQADAQVSWWEGYNDPTLNTLVDSALTRNLDLRIALARVLEVQHAHEATRAAFFPGIRATAEGSRQNTPTNTGVTGRFSESIPNFPDRFDVTTYSASLGLAYELDFWGRARANARAAFGEFIATAADYRTARIGIISETISTYFEILDVRRQLELVQMNADLLEERAEITEDRYRRGLVSSFELYGIRQTLDDVRATIPLVENGLYEARGRLAILLGTVEPELENLLDEPSGPVLSSDPIPGGLPSELLRDRPDVIAAAARLEAARQRIGVARAERFPSFSLTATGGTQSSNLGELIQTSQKFWLFGGSLTAPIFRAGALNANVRASWSRYEQAAAAYEKSVLTAFKDVATALRQHTAEWKRSAAVREALESAAASANTQLRRYRRGVGDYLALLDARINTIRVQTNMSTAERSAALARLGVHRALGGAWAADLPEIVASSRSSAPQNIHTQK